MYHREDTGISKGVAVDDATHGDEARRWSYAKLTAPVRTFRCIIAHVWTGSLARYSIRV